MKQPRHFIAHSGRPSYGLGKSLIVRLLWAARGKTEKKHENREEKK